MTQKELLYLEDAVNHEQNVIAYLNDAITNVEDENLSSFLDDEIKVHDGICKKLVNILEGLSNE